MKDSYACPICGLWCKKDGGHQHIDIMECEHDYISYPFYYVSSGDCGMKMMCRKCLKVDYIQG